MSETDVPLLFTDPDGDGVGDWAVPTGPPPGAVHWDDIQGKPAVLNGLEARLAAVEAVVALKLMVAHYAVGGAYPGRPITPYPVVWMSYTIAPPSGSGTTTSGTGPAPIDEVLYGLGVVAG